MISGKRFRRTAVLLTLGFACLLLHEFGHAGAALLTGGVVRSVTIFNLRPHVTIGGPLPTDSIQAFRTAAGSGAVITVWFIALSATCMARTLVLEALTWFSLVELCGWSISCLWPSVNPNPNDAEDFLAITGLSRDSLLTVCVAIGVCAGVMAWRTRQSATSRSEILHPAGGSPVVGSGGGRVMAMVASHQSGQAGQP